MKWGLSGKFKAGNMEILASVFTGRVGVMNNYENSCLSG